MKPLLCRLGIHRPFTKYTPLMVWQSYYKECDRCGKHWVCYP